jgi:hypothetical protein
MPRLLPSLFIAFMLLAGPALCMGGLVTHECDCGHVETEMQCQHEDSCPDDPCEALALPQERETGTLLDAELTWTPVSVSTAGMEFGSAQSSPLPVSRSRADGWNLPYEQSDRPLLI